MTGTRNKAIVIGFVGNDPEIRSFQNGDKVANFSVATSDSWKDKETGEKRERTQWHRVVVKNDGLVRKVVGPYIKKGSKIQVEGQMATREWEDRDGVKRSTTEIVLRPYRGELTLLDGPSKPANGRKADRAADAPRPR